MVAQYWIVLDDSDLEIHFSDSQRNGFGQEQWFSISNSPRGALSFCSSLSLHLVDSIVLFSEQWNGLSGSSALSGVFVLWNKWTDGSQNQHRVTEARGVRSCVCVHSHVWNSVNRVCVCASVHFCVGGLWGCLCMLQACARSCVFVWIESSPVRFLAFWFLDLSFWTVRFWQRKWGQTRNRDKSYLGNIFVVEKEGSLGGNWKRPRRQ